MNKEKFLRVTDTSCTEEAGQRTHHIKVKGEDIPITFEYGKETILPFEQGVKFMIDGFVVEEVDGSEIDLPVVPSDSIKASLASDQCVAKYSELRTTALKLRAGQKPGGEIYLDAEEEARSDIIAFLIGNPPVTGETSEEPENIDGEENLLEDDEDDKPAQEEDKLQADLEARTEKVLNHFASDYPDDRRRLVPQDNREDGVVIYAVCTVEEDHDASINEANTVVSGTFLELEAAAIEGISADRFNSDQDAKAPPPETIDKPESEEDKSETGTEPEKDADESKPETEGEQRVTLDEVKKSTDEALELAVEHGIDINDVPGTGEDGNVLKPDVEKFIAEHGLSPKEGQKASE